MTSFATSHFYTTFALDFKTISPLAAYLPSGQHQNRQHYEKAINHDNHPYRHLRELVQRHPRHNERESVRATRRHQRRHPNENH